MTAYANYIRNFITRERQYLWAVEGENEPYNGESENNPNTDGFSSMTLTQLADSQKVLYKTAKSVDPNLPVLSPGQSYLHLIPDILNAKTSQGEPMWKFFDVLAFHGYNHATNGPGDNYGTLIDQIKGYLASAGAPAMPLADTEHGWGPWAPSGDEFVALSSAQKGQLLYDTANTAKQKGLVMIGWYSYDDDLVGNPMNSTTLSNWFQKMYNDLDIKKITSTLTSTPAPASTTIGVPSGEILNNSAPLNLDGISNKTYTNLRISNPN